MLEIDLDGANTGRILGTENTLEDDGIRDMDGI